jgi:oligopeptide transport system substrate-binding protein
LRIRPTKVLNLAVALAIVSLMVVAAQKPLAAHPAGGKLTTIRLGYLENNPQWAPTLDPAVVADQNSGYLTQLMYASLVNLKTVNGKVVLYNDLAARRTLSKNGKVYTFYLHKNAKFANGDAVTAADVVFSIRRALAKQTASSVAVYDAPIAGFAKYSAGKSSFLGVKALNRTTVRFTLSERAGYFPDVLVYPINMILDKKVLQGKKTDAGGSYLTTTCRAAAQGASGPFKPVCNSNASNDVTSFYRGGSTPTLTLVPNPHYYGPKAHVKLVIPAIDSNQTGLRDFKSGGLDQTWGIPAQDQASYRGKPGAYQYPSAFIEYLGLNVKDQPFSNVHCRLAVAYGIDRNTLAKKYLHGAYKALYSFVPQGFLGYFKGHSGVPYYNPIRARKELSQCPGGIHVTYVYRNDTSDRQTEATAIAAMMGKLGITFTLKGVPRSEWLNYIVNDTPLTKTHTALAYGDWFEDYPDSQDYFFNLVVGGPGHSENFSGYNNKAFNNLIFQADAASSQSVRDRLYRTAQKKMLNQAPVIPYDNGTAFDLVNIKKVHGLVPDLYRGVVWAKNNNWAKVS